MGGDVGGALEETRLAESQQLWKLDDGHVMVPHNYSICVDV